MTAFDSFFLLFKTNRSQAIKDLGDVGKAADDLEKRFNKTSDSSENFNKQMDATNQRLKQTQDEAEDAEDKVGGLQEALTGLATRVGAAFAVWKVAEKIKSTVASTIDYNVEVGRQSRLMGINTTEVSALSSALGRLSGTDGRQALAWMSQFNLKLAELGMADRTKNTPQLLQEWAHKFANMTESDALTIGGRLGFTPEMIDGLRMAGDSLGQMVEYQKQLAPLTQQTADQSLRLAQEMEDLKSVGMGFANTLIPPFEALLHLVGKIGELGNMIIGKPLEWIFGLGADAHGNFRGGTGAGAGQQASFAGQVGATTSASAPGSPDGLKRNMRESFNFWLSQGYSPAQAAAWVGTEQGESGFNPGATGDHGAAQGSFQWHADRRALILQKTGIDVSSAGHMDQLRAAAWEAQYRGNDALIKGAPDIGSATSLITDHFEIPKDRLGAAALRTQYANADYMQLMMAHAQDSIRSADATPIGIAGSHGTSGTNLTIGTITINTQATEAKGIATDLHKELQIAVANADDGISH